MTILPPFFLPLSQTLCLILTSIDYLLIFLPLTNLTFGQNFDQSLDSFPPDLPSSLSNLTFGTCFNLSLPPLPPSLLISLFVLLSTNHYLIFLLFHLTFGQRFNQMLSSLPPLSHLTFGGDYNQPLPSLPCYYNVILMLLIKSSWRIRIKIVLPLFVLFLSLIP